MTKEESNFVSYDSLNWGGLTAAFTLKHIVRGLTFGALKGRAGGPETASATTLRS